MNLGYILWCFFVSEGWDCVWLGTEGGDRSSDRLRKDKRRGTIEAWPPISTSPSIIREMAAQTRNICLRMISKCYRSPYDM